jgi:formylglycine-generating enzyme required for sulfatase activity
MVNAGAGVAGDAPLQSELDLTLEPPVIETHPGPEYSDEARNGAMIIGMDRTPKGRIWGCWTGNGDRPDAYFILATSDDGGLTWSKPRLVVGSKDPQGKPQRRALVGNLWTDPNGRLWLFFDQSLVGFDGRAGDWSITCDNPDADEPAWSKPARIADGCTLNKPTVLKNGDWLLPVSLWPRNKISPARFREAHHELDAMRMANVFASADQGKTWTRRGGVVFPQTDFDEHMIVELRDGRLWMPARTKYGIAESFSSDAGRTWSEPRPSAIKNVSARFFVRRLASGRLLLVKNGPVNERLPKRSHMSAFLSDDDGQTWRGGLLLDERASVSYPDGFQAPDGVIHILYDWNRHTDAEILMAKFREEDVLAGRFQSADAKAQILVNKALGTPKNAAMRVRPTDPRHGEGPGQKDWVNSIGMKLVRIEPGTFRMGQDGPQADYKMWAHPAKCDDADWDERPAHRVTITGPFYMGATEVTLAQYRQFRPDHRKGQGADDEAVTFVSWHDAVKFCEWLSAKERRTYRLPTEAEWEYACRAGTQTLFHTGDSLPAGFHKWFGDIGYRERYFKGPPYPAEYRMAAGRPVLRVAQTPANAWGLFDMHGNVAEWCLDWYGPYEPGDQTDPLGRSDGDFRVIRGGSHSIFTRLLRSANRSAWLSQTSNDKTGFRVVMGELPRGRMLPPAPQPLNMQNVSQDVPEITAPPADAPFFAGPKPFVKIPPGLCGPLFSAHNHSPAIAECPNGDLLAVWYSCVDEGGSELNNLASRLRRGAAEWEPASPFWDGADVNDHAPKLWFDGERTLFHFARGWAENIVRTSTDSGATWSKAHIIQPVGEFGNAPIRTREGYLLLTHDTKLTSMVISRDGGRTWTYPDVNRRESDFRPGGKGFRHAGIHAGIVQLADGRLMTMGRYDKVEDQQRFNFKTPVSFSSDWGQTWTYEASPFPAISSVQRAVLMRLREGPLLFCSYTDQWRDWKTRKGMAFADAAGGQFTGYGLFAALSFDEGKTWPVRKLLTPGGPPRTVNGIDRVEFTLSDTFAEPCGYLAACQTRDGRIQLITSKNHYVFNLPWLKALPPAPKN